MIDYHRLGTPGLINTFGTFLAIPVKTVEGSFKKGLKIAMLAPAKLIESFSDAFLDYIGTHNFILTTILLAAQARLSTLKILLSR